jgi:NTP pyrophosphatase (non-canonical NTP hydrolase)
MNPIEKLDDYQALAVRTLSHPDHVGTETPAMLALGVAGEGGEVADYMKKVLFHRVPMDRDKLNKELGDTLWYLACLADYYGLKLSDVAYANIEKLKKRYPEGFTTEASIQRADGEINDQDHDG